MDKDEYMTDGETAQKYFEEERRKTKLYLRQLRWRTFWKTCVFFVPFLSFGVFVAFGVVGLMDAGMYPFLAHVLGFAVFVYFFIFPYRP